MHIASEHSHVINECFPWFYNPYSSQCNAHWSMQNSTTPNNSLSSPAVNKRARHLFARVFWQTEKQRQNTTNTDWKKFRTKAVMEELLQNSDGFQRASKNEQKLFHSQRSSFMPNKIKQKWNKIYNACEERFAIIRSSISRHALLVLFPLSPQLNVSQNKESSPGDDWHSCGGRTVLEAKSFTRQNCRCSRSSLIVIASKVYLRLCASPQLKIPNC